MDQKGFKNNSTHTRKQSLEKRGEIGGNYISMGAPALHKPQCVCVCACVRSQSQGSMKPEVKFAVTLSFNKEC